MKKIKNISHVGIAEHMKQLKNAEISERVGTAEYAGTADHFRNVTEDNRVEEDTYDEK